MRRKGFTLIELLIVVAIIAILAAIAVPNFLEAQMRAKVTRNMADMRSIATALESYRTDNNDYIQAYRQTIPPTQYYLSIGWLYAKFASGWESRSVGFYLTTPIAYMSAIPRDPFMTAYLLKHAVQFWGNSNFEEASVWYGMRYHAPMALQVMADGSRVLREYDDVGYYLHSIGPDLQFDYGLLNYDAGISNKNVRAAFRAVLYDPSNGTLSRGEIVYVGKGIGFPGK